MLKKLKEKLGIKSKLITMYSKCGRVLANLNFLKNEDNEQTQFISQHQVLMAELTTLKSVHSYFESNRNNFNFNTNGKKQEYDNKLGEINSTIDKLNALRDSYLSRCNTIRELENYKKSARNTDSELRAHIEKSSFDNASDFLHKLNLTGIRVFQIFIFILSTYWAVKIAVITTDTDHLVIPRGLISIVPSDTITSAQQNLSKK
jgi:hypothetical protein